MESPADQGATFVELFFDLVFVFAITRVTHYAVHHMDAHGLVRSLIVFWLIWWGWTQFTWALNAANTEHHQVRLGTLIATGVAFVMAVSVENAFAPRTEGAIWFASSYVVVRVLGLGIYYRVASDAHHRASVVTFSLLSLLGLVAVLAGGLVDPDPREWIWLGAIAFDLGAAWIVGNSGCWALHAGHFAERHGLIIIIALGESLIVAGSALTSEVSRATMAAGAIALFMTCLLWWTYFGWVAEVLEEHLIGQAGQARARLGRDAYTFWHFPLVSGIVALAVGFETALHPADYTLTQTAVAVGLGLTLFLVSTAGALHRAAGCVLWSRLIVLVLTLGGLAVSTSSSAQQILGICCLGLLVIVTIEQITIRRELASP
ncbi:MAG: low temperature requirement protein A [Gemmatimonadetes bacterium]|nr:low temperature requirement protein A [Gemmatimonadota bacterium]